MSNHQNACGLDEVTNLPYANCHPIEEIVGGLDPWNQFGNHLACFPVKAFREPLRLLCPCESLKFSLAPLDQTV